MLSALRAREPETAARSAALVLFASALVMALLPLFKVVQGHDGQWLLHLLTAAGLAAAAVICRRTPARVLDRYLVGALLSLGGVALICTLNLVTRDTTGGSQAFYALPVLWAASHLRAPAVVVVTAAALAADCLTLFLLLPAGAAASDFVIFGAVLVVMATMLVRSIRVQELLVAALQEQLTVDSLTGLATRRAFDRALAGAMNRPVPGGTALVLIDVDYFKAINDSHGHPVGDDVLVHLATVLREPRARRGRRPVPAGWRRARRPDARVRPGHRGPAGRGAPGRRPVDADDAARRWPAGALHQRRGGTPAAALGRPSRPLRRCRRRALRRQAGRPRPGVGRRGLTGGGCSGRRTGSGSLVPHSSGWRNGRRASLRC